MSRIVLANWKASLAPERVLAWCDTFSAAYSPRTGIEVVLADARPWLEIFADDVRCTHGATVGQLDENALFYLRSRGIPLGESRTMLIDAFVREITDAIAPASLRNHIAALIDAASRERQP